MSKMTVFLRKEYGQALVEYVFIMCFVSVAAVLALTEFGHAVVSLFTGVIFP